MYISCFYLLISTPGKIVVVLINPATDKISPGAFEGANLYAFLFGMN
jgi:hypothetical protein